MLWLNNIAIITSLALLLYVWLDTEAIIEWASVFRLKFMKYKEFFETRKSNFKQLSYVDFLLLKHNNFFTRLITCPYCLGVWLNVVAFCVFYQWTGGVRFLAIDIWGTWITYSGFRWLLKKFNE